MYSVPLGFTQVQSTRRRALGEDWDVEFGAEGR